MAQSNFISECQMVMAKQVLQGTKKTSKRLCDNFTKKIHHIYV